jgi:hypothetical protein
MFRTYESDKEEIDKWVKGIKAFQSWTEQELVKLEYLVGSTSQDIKQKFGEPNEIKKKRKFYYKNRSFTAEEVWRYKIKDETALYTNYNIAFAFKDEIVVGIIIY